MLKIVYFGKHIRNIMEIFKCGAGEGWRKLGGPIERTIVKNEEVFQTVTGERDILHTLTRRRLTGSVTSYCYSIVEGKIEGT